MSAAFQQLGSGSPWRHGSTRASLGRVAVIVATLAVSCVGGYAAARTETSSLLALGAVAAFASLLVVPVRALPLVALTVTLIIPTEHLPVPTQIRGLALGAIPFAIWLLRRDMLATRTHGSRALAAMLFVWLVLSEVFSRTQSPKGNAWLVTAIAVIVVPALLGRGGIDGAKFRRVFLGLASGLAVYAIVEAFVLQSNPVYGALFAQTGLTQTEGGVYRAQTLMGHPLVNGTVFAAAVMIAAHEAIVSQRFTGWPLARLALLVLGLAATQSRGSALAVAVGFLLVLIFGRAPRRGSLRRPGLLLIGFMIAALVATLLSARVNSDEGRTSAALRGDVPALTVEAMRGTTVFGAGPGESEAYRLARQLPGTQFALENSYAQLLVSVGAVGTLLFIAIIGSSVVAGLRRRAAVGEACALVAILVAAAGYNALEQHPGLLVLIGLLMSVIAMERGQDRPGVA